MGVPSPASPPPPPPPHPLEVTSWQGGRELHDCITAEHLSFEWLLLSECDVPV